MKRQRDEGNRDGAGGRVKGGLKLCSTNTNFLYFGRDAIRESQKDEGRRGRRRRKRREIYS